MFSRAEMLIRGENMSITKESLYNLVDQVDTDEYDVLFQILLKFVPVDVPSSDEIESLTIAKQQILRGELYSQDKINWSNLDSVIFD